MIAEALTARAAKSRRMACSKFSYKESFQFDKRFKRKRDPVRVETVPPALACRQARDHDPRRAVTESGQAAWRTQPRSGYS